MSEFAEIWKFTRDRLRLAYEDLTDEQMAWRPFEGGHCIFEYLYHIAGAEHYWASRLTGNDPAASELDSKLDRAVREGFLKEAPFPFGESDFDGALVNAALKRTEEELEPILANPTGKQLEMTLESPLGPIVTGREGLHRIVQHAGYHTGQIWLLRQLSEARGM